MWKDIFRETKSFKSGIGYGNRVSFWHDIWCGATPLSLAFPDVYAIASLKFGSVKDHMVRGDQSIAWCLHLWRAANDWEVLAISCLMIRIENTKIGEENDADQHVWTLDFQSEFSVCSMYNLLRPAGVVEELTYNIWNSNMPYKASFLLWLLFVEKVLTQDNLMKRGFELASCCGQCNCAS